MRLLQSRGQVHAFAIVHAEPRDSVDQEHAPQQHSKGERERSTNFSCSYTLIHPRNLLSYIYVCALCYHTKGHNLPHFIHCIVRVTPLRTYPSCSVAFLSLSYTFRLVFYPLVRVRAETVHTPRSSREKQYTLATAGVPRSRTTLRGNKINENPHYCLCCGSPDSPPPSPPLSLLW